MLLQSEANMITGQSVQSPFIYQVYQHTYHTLVLPVANGSYDDINVPVANWNKMAGGLLNYNPSQLSL